VLVVQCCTASKVRCFAYVFCVASIANYSIYNVSCITIYILLYNKLVVVIQTYGPFRKCQSLSFITVYGQF